MPTTRLSLRRKILCRRIKLSKGNALLPVKSVLAIGMESASVFFRCDLHHQVVASLVYNVVGYNQCRAFLGTAQIGKGKPDNNNVAFGVLAHNTLSQRLSSSESQSSAKACWLIRVISSTSGTFSPFSSWALSIL